MEVKTVYIAKDGTEFEEKEKCLTYEKTFSEMSEFVQFFDQDFSSVEWNPEDYDLMWNNIHYIIIEPHREKEVEDWWNKTFYNMLGVSPFYELDYDWRRWLKYDHGDEPTILVYSFSGNQVWEIFNEIYAEVNKIVKRLDLVDALS